MVTTGKVDMQTAQAVTIKNHPLQHASMNPTPNWSLDINANICVVRDRTMSGYYLPPLVIKE